MDTSKRESFRRVAASVAMIGGWLAAMSVFLYATLQYDPNHGNFAPQWVGFTFIFSIGVAIAGSAARARMRLSDTIVGAFRAGFEAADARAADREVARSQEDQG